MGQLKGDAINVETGRWNAPRSQSKLTKRSTSSRASPQSLFRHDSKTARCGYGASGDPWTTSSGLSISIGKKKPISDLSETRKRRSNVRKIESES
eukprot:29605-Pelagococcus_subviridis.AAC.8